MAILIISHVSNNSDRVEFELNVDVDFLIYGLREIEVEDEIGSVAANHYPFIGAKPPAAHEGDD